MDYFEKIKKLFQVQELSEKRISQLEKEEKIDLQLKNNFKDCPDIVFEYLLALRKLNRKHAIDMYQSHILDYPKKAEDNLNNINIYFSYNHDTCYNLSQIIAKIEP